MSRLKFPYHFKIQEFLGFLAAWDNTLEEHLAGWIKLASTQPDSAQAVVLSLFWTWNRQLALKTMNNPLYIQWLYRGVEIVWPYGTKNIPVGICGEAICGWSVCGMDFENAIS